MTNKSTENRLQQHKSFINDSFSLLIIDINNIIQHVNPMFCELFKYAPSELIGKSFYQVLIPELQNILTQTLEVKENKESSTVLTIKDKEGKNHWFKTYITPFHTQDGDLEEIYLIMSEMNEYMEARDNTRTQAALYQIIEITNKNISTKQMLTECLDVLLNLSWFKVEGKGGFMLKEKDKEELNMVTHKGLGEDLLKMCNVVPFGTCLCGIAAQTKQFVHASCIDHRHHNRPEGMTPHGHYNIPILWRDEVLGVIVLYLEHGYAKKQSDESFLKIVAETIAATLYRKRIQKEQEDYLRTQQSQAVLYQIIETSNKPTEEEEMVGDCLEILLNINWLKVQNKGGVFLKDLQKDELKLIAHKGLGESLLKMCKIVPFGTCLCGIAAQTKKFVHASCVDHRHHNKPEGMTPHGHYNIPILWREEVLGVIVLYLEHGHQKSKFEKEFLTRVSETIAAAIFRKRTRRTKDRQAQEIQNQNNELNVLHQNVLESHKLLKLQTEQLKKKQGDVIASITYAKRIQSALIPQKSNFANLFEDSFILDKPRDIVGGDFCWFMERNNLVFVIVADCTGHGVPGAFMTVIANNIIDDIIKERGYVIPTQILDSLDKGIKKALHQEQTKNNDGMDLTLTVIDKVDKKIYFSGASSPLIYLTQEGSLTEIKGTRRHIGGSQVIKKQDDFKMEIINIEKNTWFYLFTDGYRDQFRDETQKYGKKRFRELLQSLHQLSGEEQHQRLEAVLAWWSGEHKQIDDILCLGFKL
jgi:PAS domain S-box-containing protein